MKLVLIAMIAVVAIGENFLYRRVLDCVANNSMRCTHWKQSTALSYQTYYTTFCFSENTFVQTKEGPKSMGAMRINDEVLGFDPATGKQTFSKVVAWLHRDTQAIAKYDSVATKQGASFEASDYHNIAFANSDGKIDFKFAKDLREGDELIGLLSSAPVVDSVQPEGERRGLYSPFTEVGNYYVFNSAFRGEGDAKAEPMILAHVLSQVSNPNSKLGVAKAFVDFWEKLGLNKQPLNWQRYTHALISYFSFIFGSNWIAAKQAVKYEINHDQALPAKSSSSSSSSSYSSSPTYSSSYPSYSSPTYYSPASSYSSNPYGYNNYPYNSDNSYSNSYYDPINRYSYEQERQDKMAALGLSLSIIQEFPLL